MWKDYLSGYIKNNRASSRSVMAAAFIAALLLSLLCSMFYNLWTYEIHRLKVEEGDWQGRIIVDNKSDLDTIRNFANVEKVSVNEELSKENAVQKFDNIGKESAEGELIKEELSADKEIVADVCFKNMRSIFKDMPKIAEKAGVSAESISYHYSLLNMYLIRDSSDTALRWVFPFFVIIVLLACISLVLVIHNAFAVTMNARIRQFGIFSSIGAAPGQIRACLLQEAFALCTFPIAAGSLSGIFMCMGIAWGINLLLADVKRRLVMPFEYHPLILLLSIFTAVLTILVSAWIPARKLSKLTPLQALKNTGEMQLKKKKSSRILSFLFGIEGEIAGNALKAQKKAMRTTAVSLTFSFLAFSSMMCFITITIISQRETYFEKYQDAWDVMVTVKDTPIDAVKETDALQGIPDVQSCVMYQKADAKRMVALDEISEEMMEIGGFENAPDEYVSAVGNEWLVNAPVVIMDDDGFLDYCGQIGALRRLDGAVIRNKTLDGTDSNFRRRRSLAYLTGEKKTTILRSVGQEWEDGRTDRAKQEGLIEEIPVLGYTQEVPNLREEYGTLDFYELVHFIPVSCWKGIKGKIGGMEEDTYIRILAKDRDELSELNEIEDEISRILGQTYEIEVENRIQDKLDNDNMMNGMKAILSIFCMLLALIGIGNVFSITFGFVRQRRREFARYMSIGLTPEGMKKIFCIEALVIAGRPVLIAMLFTAAAAAAFIKMSYLEPMLFLKEMPVWPIVFFILAVFGFVALAYGLGAKKLLQSSLTDSLRNDVEM